MEQNSLVTNNIKLVHHICKRYKNSYHEYEDLFQEGCAGLVTAASRFNPEFGNKFSTYAIPYIEGHIKRYIRDTSVDGIKYNRPMMDLRSAYMKLFNEGYHREKISEILHLNEITLSALENMANRCSLDSPINLSQNDDKVLYLSDLMSSFNNLESTVVSNDLLSNIKGRVCTKHYEIFQLSMQGFVQTEIASMSNLSQAQVSRIVRRVQNLVRSELSS